VRRPSLPVTPCPTCAGRGEMPGANAGEVLRLEREERRVTRTDLLRHFARPDGGLFSESYTIDLERGARPFTWDLIERYRAAIKAAVDERVSV